MTVPVSNIISTSISVSSASASYRSQGNMVLLTDEASLDDAGGFPVRQRYRVYGQLPDVTDDWPVTSEVYAAASAYFSQSPQPQNFYVYRVSYQAADAVLVGGPPAELAVLQAITAGGFSLQVDGADLTATDVDLTSASSYDDVASLVTASLSSATILYSDGRFSIDGGEDIGFAEADVGGLAEAMGLTQVADARIDDALTVETPLEGLAACREIETTGYMLVPNRKWRDNADARALGDVVGGYRMIMGNTTNDRKVVKDTLDTTNIALYFASNGYVLTSYSSEPKKYPSASVAGRIATVNYEGRDTTITMFGKQLPTITIENLTTSEKTLMESRNANAYLAVGGVSAGIYTDSRMGDGSWLDVRTGIDWLVNRIEVDMFNLFTSKGKVPGTDAGVSEMEGTLVQGLQQAVTNGLAAPGEINGVFYASGYVVHSTPVADLSSATVHSRIYPGFSFELKGAGAFQGAVITGTFIE